MTEATDLARLDERVNNLEKWVDGMDKRQERSDARLNTIMGSLIVGLILLALNLAVALANGGVRP